jgi:hypothetical protein
VNIALGRLGSCREATAGIERMTDDSLSLLISAF